MSAVWTYFNLRDDRSKADCKLWQEEGRDNTSFNTSNHLMTHHGAEFTEFANASSSRPQQSLTHDMEKREKIS